MGDVKNWSTAKYDGAQRKRGTIWRLIKGPGFVRHARILTAARTTTQATQYRKWPPILLVYGWTRSLFGNSLPTAIRRGNPSPGGNATAARIAQKSGEDRLLSAPCLPIRTGRHDRVGRQGAALGRPRRRDTGDTTRDAERRNSNIVKQLTSDDTCRQKSIRDNKRHIVATLAPRFFKPGAAPRNGTPTTAAGPSGLRPNATKTASTPHRAPPHRCLASSSNSPAPGSNSASHWNSRTVFPAAPRHGGPSDGPATACG